MVSNDIFNPKATKYEVFGADHFSLNDLEPKFNRIWSIRASIHLHQNRKSVWIPDGMIKNLVFQLPTRTFVKNDADLKAAVIKQDSVALDKYLKGPTIIKSFYYKLHSYSNIVFQKDTNFTKKN